MTHSRGKSHAIGDREQRWEVSFFDPAINARRILGWTNDHATALMMANSIEKHPEWQFAWVTDRNVTKGAAS